MKQTSESPLWGTLCNTIGTWFFFSAIALRIFLPGLAVEMSNNALVWLFSLGSFVFLGIGQLEKKYYPVPHSPRFLLLFIFPAYFFLSSFWASDVAKALHQGMFLCGDIALFLSLGLIFLQHKNFPTVVAFLVSCLIVETFYVFYQCFIGLPASRALVFAQQDVVSTIGISAQSMSLFLDKLKQNQAFGHFTLPNSLGGYMIMWLPILICFMINAKRNNQRSLGFWYIATLAVTTALFFSKSRSSFLVLGLVSVAVIFLLLRRYSQISIIFGFVFCAFGLLFCLAAFFTDYLDFVGISGLSLVMRTAYWEAAWQIWQENFWWGVGGNNFSLHYGAYRPVWAEEVQNAHNLYLQAACELGSFGVIAFFLLLFSLFSPNPSRSENEVVSNEDAECISQRAVSVAILTSLALVVFLGYFLEMESLGALWQEQQLPFSWSSIETFVLGASFLLFAGIWIVSFCFVKSFIKNISADQLRFPVTLSLLIFAVHASLDLHAYVPTLTQNFWLILGVGWWSRDKYRLVALSSSSRWSLGVLLVGVLFFVNQTVITPVITYSHLKENLKAGSSHLGKDSVSQENHLLLLQQALQSHPTDLNFQQYRSHILLRQIPAHPREEQKKMLRWLDQEYRSALSHHTRNPFAFFTVADFQFSCFEIYQHRDLHEAKWWLTQANISISQAIALYPTKGDILYLASKIKLALQQKQEGLMLLKKQTFVEDMGFRMWSSPDAQQRKNLLEDISRLHLEKSR